MSLVYYYSPMSTASITTLVLEELGVPHEKVKLDLRAGDQKKPEYLKLNPNGQVPLLVVDGEPVFESVAITLYLGETYGVEKGLFPAPGKERAAAMKWLVWCHVTLGGALSRFMQNTSQWIPEEQHNAKAGEAAKAAVEANLGVLNEALTGKQYLVGNKFSLVDAHLSSYLGYVQMCGFDLAKYPAVAAWAGRCHATPAAQRVMKAEMGA